MVGPAVGAQQFSYPESSMQFYPQPYGITYGNPTEKNGLGIAALVFGFFSFICLGPLVGIPAIILGVMGRRAVDMGRANNRGIATAGMVLGIVGSVLSGFIIIMMATY
jgi:hypothetical protein